MKKNLCYLFMALVLPPSLWAATIFGTVHVGTATGPGLAGVKVVLFNGALNGIRIDSTTTDSTGHYQITGTTVTNGARTIWSSKSGYNSGGVLFPIPTDTSHVIMNPIMTINNKTSSIAGMVKRALDSSVVINATVILTGGPDPAVNIAKTTDSVGAYLFDSMATGTGYTLSLLSAKYNSANSGTIATSWNSLTTVPTFYLTQNLGTLSGTVRSSGAGSPVIAGAKVVVLVGAVKVDSTITNASGQYVMSLSARSYAIQVSAVGNKSNTGTPTKDTTTTIVQNTTTYLNISLFPTTSLGGRAYSGPPTTVCSGVTDPFCFYVWAPFAGGKLYLQSAPIVDSGNYMTFDSLITASNGNYRFHIESSEMRSDSGHFRIATPAQTLNGMVYPLTTDATVPRAPITIGIGDSLGRDVYLTGVPVSIYSNTQLQHPGIHFTIIGNQLAIDLGSSNSTRIISIFNMNGSLKRQIDVPAGESRVFVPASFAPENGFLFQVR